MATQTPPSELLGNRQAAFSARNRARLVKAAQEILAEIGPSATLEQISTHAQVSPTTIYKYFQNKEQLFAVALNETWVVFLTWAESQNVAGDRLGQVLDSGRKLFWSRQTHPLLANIIRNCLADLPDIIFDADRAGGKKVFRELAKSGEIEREDFEKRYSMWTNIYSGLLRSIFVTEEMSPREAEIAFGIGLSVWGISEAKAKKLISRPLDLFQSE
jgi:AcrR family transcriptional regulator